MDGGNDDEFALQNYLECQEVDDDLYVGPYCDTSTRAIKIGEFTDEACTVPATEGSYYAATGNQLRYTQESILTNDCAMCNEFGENVNQNNNPDDDNEDAVIEPCENLYAAAGKCEKESFNAVDNPDAESCDYIKTVKRAMNKKRNYTILAICAVVAMMLLVCVIGYMRGSKSKKRGDGLLGGKKKGKKFCFKFNWFRRKKDDSSIMGSLS